MGKLSTSGGTYLAADVRPGDPFELSRGHTIDCLPTGGRGSKAEGAGFKVISTDPDVEDIGIDTGYSPKPDTLRAPDISAGKISDEPGWVAGVPRLAVEYADTGQDEQGLAEKIEDLLEAGTELIWVVRLAGPRRVEVHRPQQGVRIAHAGEELEAPGILRHPVLVDSLYDEDLSNKVALRNLLEREEGYESLDQVRDEGRLGAARADLLAVLEARDLAVDATLRAAIAECEDPDRLHRWLVAAVTAPSAQDAMDA